MSKHVVNIPHVMPAEVTIRIMSFPDHTTYLSGPRQTQSNGTRSRLTLKKRGQLTIIIGTDFSRPLTEHSVNI